MGSSRSLQPGKARCASATASGWREMKRKVASLSRARPAEKWAASELLQRAPGFAPNCARACSSLDVTMLVGVFSARIGRDRSQW